MKKNDIEATVDNYLAEIGVTCSVLPAGENLNRDGWTCDGWRVDFKSATGREQFDYYTGTGHRVIVDANSYRYKSAVAELKTLNPRCIAAESARKVIAEFVRPFAPFAAGVLYSLVLDSNGAAQSFRDWCADYGYDSDSIKALTTYNACGENAEKMRRVFTREQMAKLTELLQDY